MRKHREKLVRFRVSQVSKSKAPGPRFRFSGPRFGFSRSDFRKKVLREPGSKRRKIKVPESIQIDSNRSKDLQNDLDSMFSSHFRRFRQKSPNLLPFPLDSASHKIHPSISWVQGQNLDRAGTCPCTDPQEYLMVQGHSSDSKMSRCRATPVNQNML